MLNRSKIAHLVSQLSGHLSMPHEDKKTIKAYDVWKHISNDKNFLQKVHTQKSSFLIPTWDNNLDDIKIYTPTPSFYTIVGVDGSQIYPERHLSGIGCFVINAGGCILNYHTHSSVNFFSEPIIMLTDDIAQTLGAFTTDMVDLQREAYELRMALEKAHNLINQHDTKPYCFFDGSLIFWHLEGKPEQVSNYYLQEYLQTLEYFYSLKILVAGYISMPKSRELINIIKLGMCPYEKIDCIKCHQQKNNGLHEPCNEIDPILDTHLCRQFLPRYARTTIFYSTSNIVHHYPQHLRPAFFYLHVGSEIVRIEIPTWIAHQEDYIDAICSIAIDQAIKGNGYPVVLSEAHEQAIIRGADRDFFFHLLGKNSIEHHKRLIMSPKSIKKRGLGI